MRLLALCLTLSLSLFACRRATPVEKEPPSSAPSASQASLSPPLPSAPPSASALPRRDGPRSVGLEPFEGAPKETSLGLAAVDGAVAVFTDDRVGRINGGAIEWIDKKLPFGRTAMGRRYIREVSGSYPDKIDVITVNEQARAPEPMVFPFTGKGAARTVAEGGGAGIIHGIARVGETTLVSSFAMQDEGTKVVVTRGPPLNRTPMSREKLGCRENEVEPGLGDNVGMRPEVFGATRAGTVISVGKPCGVRAASAEVWDKTDKAGVSKIVELDKAVGDLDPWAEMLLGEGDELFVYPGKKGGAFIHYRDGQFSTIARPAWPVVRVAMSSDHKLYAYDGQVVHRLEGERFVPVAKLAWPTYIGSIVVDGETIWVSKAGQVHRLVDRPGVEVSEGCKTPFVYLYDVPRDNPKNFTYPTTRKALASFEGGASLSLVEFDEGDRRLGVAVKSVAEGEALLAHLKTAMPKERPQLICYQPTPLRTIEVGKGK